MNYYDACEWIVTRAEAKAEIDKHDCDGGFAAFIAEVGDREEYTGKDVLDWLGY
ncbi:conserved hypothethical protein (plasmid) [Ralstonia solanacearum CMR15]|nr:conserved hypothethical protein [Ralstonia solanacearum CMR15]